MLSRIFRAHTRALPITLYPNHWELRGHLASSIILMIGGALGLKDNFVMGAFTIAFFGTCATVFILQMHPSKAYLKLDYKGFTVRSLHYTTRISWDTVAAFTPVQIQNQKFVRWTYTPEYVSQQANMAARALSSHHLHGTLPNRYGMKPQQLAELMNNLCKSYRLAQYYQTH